MFKVGDRVRVIELVVGDDDTNLAVGDCCTISEISDLIDESRISTYYVKFDKELIVSSDNANLVNGTYCMFYFQLELVERGE